MFRMFWECFVKTQATVPSRQGSRALKPFLEALEDRLTPSTFLVTNLKDAGLGSLRQALLDSNDLPGPDLIHFGVAGSIRVTSGALPFVTDHVTLDGATAPGFTGAPVIKIDINGFAGIQFDAGSAGSALKSLALVNAADDGVILAASDITVVGNYIGLQLNGRTAAGNGGDGIEITAASTGNVIGGTGANERNVIAANGGNGIVVDGSSDNRIRANFIGTDATGKRAIGNGGNGILLLGAGATNNIIGGTTPGNPAGTTPPNFSGVRPPEGNLISGNAANGVLLTDGASNNFLAGNFIGTTASGVRALGNVLDGVAILNGSNGNTLAGTFLPLDPFIFYNVVSGNRGNGLRISNSNDTTIHANFFGLGSDDKTPVGNGLNGVVVEGSSANTQFGGRVPLGNVVTSNRQNGVVVKDTASGFEAFNTFCGLGAFVDYPNLGNGRAGFLITSSGADNLILFNLISSNGGNGVELGGQASGVQVVKNGIGVNLKGTIARPNRGHGVEITGNAHDNIIGGHQPLDFPTLGARNVIAANRGYGVAVTGAAHDNQVNAIAIGRVGVAQVRGNGDGGVFLGSGTARTTVGSSDPDLALLTTIGGNRGPGITMTGTHDNIVIGTRIGIDEQGDARSNLGDGIRIVHSSGNQIGGDSDHERNVIAYNHGNGVWGKSGTGNGIRQNSIFANTSRGIRLSQGANNNQGAPVLTTAISVLGGLLVSGRLNSTPNTTFTIELFADSRTRHSAEGRFFLGSVTATTDSNGHATFSRVVVLPASTRALTATATDPLDNTSEFSHPLRLQS